MLKGTLTLPDDHVRRKPGGGSAVDGYCGQRMDRCRQERRQQPTRWALVTSLCGVLVLILSIAAAAEPNKPPASQPAPALPLSSPLNDSRAWTAPQQLDEDLRLITGNNEPDVRLIGAKRVLALGTDEAAQRLISVLQANPPDLAAQIAICEALAGAGPKMPQLVEPLIGLLGDQRVGLGDAVAQALRGFENGGVVDRLQAIAADVAGNSIEKREAAVRVLGEMGENMHAVAALVRLASDGTSAIRQAALISLEQATGVAFPDAASALSWWEARKSTPAQEWSRAINEHHVEQIRISRERSRLLARRLVAACREAYVRAPSADRPKKLLTFLGDDLPEIRALGLELTNALITDRKEISQEIKTRLVEMVADPDPGLRQKVAAMVGDLRLPEAEPKLLEVLARELDYRARAAEVDAIGRLDGVSALPALLTCLADDAAPVVGSAAMALAAVSRRMPEDTQATVSIATALLARYKLVPPADVDLREKLLEAMARLGAESFRPVFRALIVPDQPARIRRAAIIGLGTYGDAPAANEVRPFVTSTDPEIRLAAVQAMGPCGRTMEDLESLAGRLDSTSEADPAVRERAWESYLQVALRMPPAEWLSISDGLARPNDQLAQRRRVEMLKAITGSAQKLKQLPVQGQVGAFERMGDAQSELGDYQAAAASYEEAIALVQERSGAKFTSLAGRLLTALIRSHQDRVAVQRLAELCNGGKSGARSGVEPLVQVLQQEIRARGEAATDAAAFTDVLKLVDIAAEAATGIAADLAPRLEGERTEIIARRSAAVDRLLDAVAADPQAEAKLLAYGKELVLPKLLARLTAWPASAPAAAGATDGAEEKLIRLAKQWVEQWPGYAPGCPRDERTKALNSLKELSASMVPVGPTTGPTV